VLFYFTCQLLLLFPSLNQLRVLVRSAAYLGGIALIACVPSALSAKSAVKSWAYVIIALLAVQTLHPEGGTALAVFAQFGLYLSIIGAVFWVSRIDVTLRVFEQLVVALWLYYTASAVSGVLQTYFPGSFQPALSTVLQELEKDKLMSLQIQLASGERVFRPMGLSDVPGGAAYGGMYAVLLGIGILQSRGLFRFSRLLAALSMIAGAMCLYLCQVRALVVMTGVCMVTMIGILIATGRIAKFLGTGVVVAGVSVVALLLALSVGGEQVSERLYTLTEGSAGTVYYNHRGRFLEQTVLELLPKYPLGAGLGHWGMAHRYFGTRADHIWVEIQWTGWLLDGGIPLIFAYVAAIATATLAALGVAKGEEKRVGDFGTWGALLVAYNVGALALCFSYALFIGNGGIEFWLLNATFLQATRNLHS
jgi:hypothetical protein